MDNDEAWKKSEKLWMGHHEMGDKINIFLTKCGWKSRSYIGWNKGSFQKQSFMSALEAEREMPQAKKS